MRYRIKKCLAWILCMTMVLAPVTNAAASEADYLQAAEMITEISTETEEVKRPSTEAVEEKITEAVTEKQQTKMKSEAVTEEAQTEAVKEEKQTEAVTEEQQKEQQTETVTEEQQKEQQTETATEEQQKEQQTETVTEELQTEIQTEAAAEGQETEIQTEAVTEEQETEVQTEAVTEEQETEIQTEAVTEEQETEIQTEAVTEEQETEASKREAGEIFPVDYFVVTALEENYGVKLGTPETAFSKIYVGCKEDVEKTPEYIGVERTQGGYEFLFEITGDLLGKEISIVPYITEEGEWYTEEDVKITVPVDVIVPETLLVEETETVAETVELYAETDILDESYKDGDYDIAIESGFAMFAITSQSAKVTDGVISVTIGTGKNTYDKIYLGSNTASSEEMAAGTIQGVKKEGEDGYLFTFEIPADLLGQSVDFVPGKPDGSWYVKKQYQLTFPEKLEEIQETPDTSDTPDTETEEPADGDYSVEVESSDSMFKVVNCILMKKDGKYTAEITLSGTGYDYLYMGNGADAVAAGQDTWISVLDTVKYTNSDGEEKTGARYVIPVSALDTPIAISAHSAKKDVWYERTLTFKSETIKEVEKPLNNGDYNVSVETGESMFKVVNAVLSTKDGKMTAVITLSGTGYDYLYIGSSTDAESADSKTWISVEDTVKYTNANGEEKTGARYIIPVSALDTPIPIASHAVKSGKWTDRTLTFVSTTLDKIESGETETETESESETETETESETESNTGTITGTPDDSTAAVDNSTTLADGVYSPESFSFAGGSGRTKITCVKITVKDGKAYATIQFSSSSYDYVKAAGYKFDRINTSGNSVFEIPVRLNADNVVIGNTTAMSTATEITYTIHPVLSEAAETEKETESENITEKETEKETEGTGQVDPDKLQNGDYRVQVDSSAAMFRVIDCVLTYKDGVMTAKITLSGTGYDKLFMGNSTSAASASDSQKIGYTVNAEGKYVFEVPVSALDTPIAIAAHSHKNKTWYDREITFRSSGMTLLKEGESTKVPESETETEKETDKKENNKADKESAYESDLSGGTGRVDSSTGLKDGVYTPDKFSWSGGSGRTSISCSKVTVTGGQAYATIVFSSSSYGYVKANGNKYFPSYGAGTSSFTIPVRLNANNTIIGMTTAMSAAHEITYTIYVYIAGADKKSEVSENAADQTKLSEKAPEIIGLEYTDEAVIEYAEYFKMYYYDQDITLIEIDMATDTEEEDTEEASEETEESEVKDADTLIAELYQNQIVKYLLVPEGVEIPVGLDKEMIVIQLPVESIYTDSVEAKEILKEMELEECITVENEVAAEKPDYKELILNECKLAILSDEFLQDEEHMELLYEVTERLTTLGIPALIDRSAAEESEEAKAEWQMIYDELFR